MPAVVPARRLCHQSVLRLGLSVEFRDDARTHRAGTTKGFAAEIPQVLSLKARVEEVGIVMGQTGIRF
jgi:hypothetical protein